MSALSVTVAPGRRGLGLSRLVLQALKDAAARAGLDTLLAPVRPSAKSAYPLTPLERYVRWARPDGAPFDPWLRTHWRLGGEVLGVCPASMEITALHPSMAEVAVAEAPATVRRSRWRLVPLGAAAVLAPAVQLLEWTRGRPIEVPVVAVGSIVMFLLIVARTRGLTREVTVQDERRRLLGRVLQAAEDERTRIAHDLHDGPVQQLAVLNYDIYRARKRLAELTGQGGTRA